MAFDYSELAELSGELVEEFGIAATVKRSVADQKGNPWDISESEQSFDVHLIDQGNEVIGIGGSENNVAIRNRTFFVAPVPDFIPKVGDRLVFADSPNTLDIGSVSVIKPGDTVIGYELSVSE